MGITNKDTLGCAWITVEGQGQDATYIVSPEDPNEIQTQPTRETFPKVYAAQTYQELCSYLKDYGLNAPTRAELQATPEEIEDGGEVVRKVTR